MVNAYCAVRVSPIERLKPQLQYYGQGGFWPYGPEPRVLVHLALAYTVRFGVSRTCPLALPGLFARSSSPVESG